MGKEQVAHVIQIGKEIANKKRGLRLIYIKPRLGTMWLV